MSIKRSRYVVDVSQRSYFPTKMFRKVVTYVVLDEEVERYRKQHRRLPQGVKLAKKGVEGNV